MGDAVERFVGRRFDTLNLIGRCATSDVWCQTVADALNRPVHRMTHPEVATSRGAALVALVALDRIQMADVPRLVPVEKTFSPVPGHVSTLDQLFDAWLAGYKANKSLFHRLARIRRASQS